MQPEEIATLVSGTLEHAVPDMHIRGIQTLNHAVKDDASFLANMRYKQQVETSQAGLILLDEHIFPNICRPVIRVKDPYLAFAKLQRYFHPLPVARGLRAASAVIDASANIADNVDIEDMVVIGKGVRIATGCRIGAGCVIEDDAVIGADCILHPRCVIGSSSVLGKRVILQAGAVIASDGFGYAWTGKEHLHIPQKGRVILEDDVEIGANACIDRGAIGDTTIGVGTKLDNLIQIGHNVQIGAYSIMASQVGISGSTVIGKGCQVGGQVGMAGHLHIGDGCRIAAKTGVPGDLEAGGTYAGIPAMPHRTWLRVVALLTRLPEMWKLINRGEK